MFRNIHLESEIIIYRDLLECFEIRERVVIAPTQVETTTRKIIIVESYKKESIGLSKCYVNIKEV